MNIYIKMYFALWCFLLFPVFAPVADAAPIGDAIDFIAKTGEIDLTVAEDKQEDSYRALLSEAEAYLQQHNDDSAAWVACAVARANLSKFGGMKALTLLKQVRQELEHAIEMDPKALNGYAQAFLGRMYLVVPGWPLSFGSDKKAKEYSEAALAISENSVENNFYYGLFLMEKKQYRQAREYLQKAQDAHTPIDRPIWKDYLQRGIDKALATVEEKLRNL